MTASDRSTTPDSEEVLNLLNEFEQLRREQWEKGAREYGPNAFLNLSPAALFNMVAEELADVANYAMMQFVRIKQLGALLEGSIDQSSVPAGEDPKHGVPLGASAFTSRSDLQGFLQPGERPQDS